MRDSRLLLAAEKRLETRWVDPPPDRAPTLVFLHEGLRSASLWKDFPDRLAAETGCGALVYSRAGYGASDPVILPRPVRFMHDEARQILPALLDAAGVREAVLVGHSDGGSIALLHAACCAGSRVRGLALEAPHVFVEEFGLRNIARAAEAYRTTDLRAKLERHHGANVDAAFWGWNRVWLDPAFRSWNIEAELPRVRVPIPVIQGEDDEYGTLAQVDAIRRQAAGEVETLVLRACGHSPHRDQPEATLRAIARFARRVLPSARADPRV